MNKKENKLNCKVKYALVDRSLLEGLCKIGILDYNSKKLGLDFRQIDAVIRFKKMYNITIYCNIRNREWQGVVESSRLDVLVNGSLRNTPKEAIDNAIFNALKLVEMYRF